MFDHDQKELFEIDCLVIISVGVAHHLLQLLVRDSLAQGFHNVLQLLGIDRLVSVLVKQLKRFVKRLDLFIVELEVLELLVIYLRHPSASFPLPPDTKTNCLAN